MAESETAVLEPEATASEPESQEGHEALAENEPGDESTETDGASEETTENEEEPRLTKADLEAAVKAEAAKVNESWRQRAENQRKEVEEKAFRDAHAERVTRAQAARSGKVAQDLLGFTNWVKAQSDQGKEISPQQVGQAIQRLSFDLDNMAFIDQHEAYGEFVDKLIEEQFPDYRPSREVERRIRVTRERLSSDGTAAEDATRALVEKIVTAVRETETPKIRKELEAALKESQQKAGKTAALKQQSEQRANSPRPSSVNGNGARMRHSYKTIAELDAAIEANPELLPRGPSSRTVYAEMARGLPYQ